MSFGSDPEEDRRRAAAGIVKLRVGLALIDDARHAGGFETDATKLAARVEEILSALAVAGLNPVGAVVEATLDDVDRITLSTPVGENGSDSASLRSDGVLLSHYTSMGTALVQPDVDELSPEQQEEIETAQAEWLEQVQREFFQGTRFLRALPLDPQPGAEVQLLAAELFADGLVVHYSFERTQEELEASCIADEAAMLERDSWDATGLGLRLEDDLGTEYRSSGGGGGGAGVVRSFGSFTPAVPDAARTLRISVGANVVECDLRPL